MVETALPPFQHQIENWGVENRLELQLLPGCGGAGKDEDARGRSRSPTTKSNQSSTGQRLAQPPLRTLRSSDERIDASGSEQAFAKAVYGIHSSHARRRGLRVDLLALAGLTLDDLLNLLLHGTGACHGGCAAWAPGAAFLRAARFSFLAIFGRFNALCIHRVFVIRPL